MATEPMRRLRSEAGSPAQGRIYSPCCASATSPILFVRATLQPIAREFGVPVAADFLARMRNTPSQAKLSPVRRLRNVRGAFYVRRQWRDRVAGLNILLVDDVLTTGATVEEFTKTLLAEGAVSVDVGARRAKCKL
jgi:predicted amidophosphoribosyltransferase